MEIKTRSPFKFLDSYSKEDRTIFFGRDEEIEELHFRVFKGKILLLFGVSGVGKTSLIKCGLANKIDEKDWYPIHIRRGDNLVNSLVRELEKCAVTPIQDIEKAQATDILESIYLDHFKPLYLIFDQFEEIFIFGNKSERAEFISTIRQVTTSRIQCRIIFSIREEYLGKLTEFEDEIPDLLSNRVRINPMTRHHAREVIEKSCQSYKIYLEPGCSDLILSELFPGETEIDLAFLQIFLDQLYLFSARQDKSGTEIRFTLDLIRKFGNVKDILGTFLEEEISQLENKELAFDILKAFVSDKGTKQQASEKEIIEEISSPARSIDENEVNQLLQRLVNIRILRDRDEDGKYELRHDSLASKINEKITLPEKELKEIRKFIRNALDKYSRSGILLNIDDLKFINPYLKNLFLNPEEKDFVTRSKALIMRRKQKRRNLILVSTMIFIFCLTGLTIWALLERTGARKAAIISRSNETASFSILNLDKDPSLSFRLAERSFNTYKGILAMEALSLAYETGSYNPFYCELDGHHSDIYCMDYTPHGNRIITGSFDSTARIWNMEGKLLNVLTGHNGKLYSARFSPDGKLILTSSTDGTVRVWNLQGKLIDILRDPDEVNYMAEFSPDSRFIITGSAMGMVTVWKVTNPPGACTLLYKLKGHTATVNSIHFSHEGNYFATTSKDQTARIWDFSGRCVTVLQGHTHVVRDLSFSPDDSRIITSSIDATVRMWDTTGKQLKILTGHTGDITRCDYTPDGKHIVSIADDHTIVIWNSDGEEEVTIRPNIGSLDRLGISPDGKYFAIGADNGVSQVYSMDGYLLYGLFRYISSIRDIKFAGDDSTIITASQDGTAKIWKLTNPDLMAFEQKVNQTLQVAITGSRKELIVLDKSNNLSLLDLGSGNTTVFPYSSTGVSASFSPDRKLVLTASLDYSSRVWNREGKEVLALTHPLSVKSAEFSPDGKTILTSCNDGAARLWNMKGEVTREFRKDKDLLNCAAFSPDGSKVIMGSTNSLVTIWNSRDGSLFKSLTGHQAEVTKARYAPDGSYILTTSKDGVAMLWNPSGNLIVKLGNSHRTAIDEIGFSHNGDYFFTLSKNPYCIQIRSRNGDLVNIINLGDATDREHYPLFAEDGKSLLVITSTKNRVYLKKWPLQPEELLENVNQRQIFGKVRQLSGKEIKDFFLDN